MESFAPGNFPLQPFKKITKMRKIRVILFSLFLLSFTHVYSYDTNPETFIRELVDDAISKIADKNLNEDEKATYIEKIALENVDIQALSLYTLGELRKSTSKDILKNFMVVVPPKIIIDQFQKIAEPIHKKCQLLMQENQKLISLKEILTFKLVSGKISISDYIN